MTPGNIKEFKTERRAQDNLLRTRQILHMFGETFGRGCFLVMGDYKWL